MCGIFGITGHAEASNLTYLGLHALQHRGQESAGIVASDGHGLRAHRQMGLVADIFDAPVLAGLPGQSAIGHVRYSTAGGSQLKNAQPLFVAYAGGQVAVAHNGNLVNAGALKEKLEADGAIFQSDADTEVIMHLLARSKQVSFEQKLVEALRKVEGAYSLLVLTQNKLVAVRDPLGIRPLVLGRMKEGAYVVASETTALDLIEADVVRELEPGELLVIENGVLRTSRPFAEPPRLGRCIFEQVYFARPDSVLFGNSVYEVRKQMGMQLAREQPAPDADLVIAVPDSGVAAAIGFSQQSGIPYDVGLIRSHYVGRTFIEPQQSIRHFGVKLKLSAVRHVLKGKRVVVVDDSIVRGTTSRKIVKMIKAAGALEVHLRISSPPTKWPCFYGIDTPSRQELIAATHSTDEIAKYVTADTLGYISLEGLGTAVGDPSRGSFCTACFSGEYLIGELSPSMPEANKLTA
ncbi:amidophosphoribosyltransferase [Myxococcus llanfairpwllgwyngyllgogerychwyrndrobwllllantysiliogogogochensis]|uniref:Amidophosphoribosyltransferase n=1 Tax=Myxococcus llanfairpwllgwyngyllgogerychwyrndrobwllllantysiliogogogochensis TaxID=2590453 RepID=A0A540X1T6_9BACT|nr:amidophosphoribosyltransferase [Myxococcus llanfairpwllgwyngyllgogerychwyrndrobwllllantysiliogogogochensis]TQF15183.1 amidophosphoribosyltransferase [Myxococcus llanfairpwllgwyngyllgogerychwyrndrobwllllantysiliogogogochensis]